MKAIELREKNVDDLNSEHLKLLHEMFNLRMQKASGQPTKSHEVKRVRRAIARLLTIIKEKMGTEV